ncbi:Oidioi.mRNA.OKI2018_I69.XSR.g15238.t1.cds [Oikopleura dioica]|uniref:Oidioi.mRNA.OKI2018_I69.XSR.g15238.t1.cds n=1 Tax=Oikopleura dioica TaxID=34765 RepID=A0ABN7SLB8_OIKDI|nr:Oidioi.mRNA.OKI2018_I69.XSR.g15238.t1.cds [Oikopleura dioica]
MRRSPYYQLELLHEWRLQQYRRSIVQTKQDNSNLIEEKFGQKVKSEEFKRWKQSHGLQEEIGNLQQDSSMRPSTTQWPGGI